MANTTNQSHLQQFESYFQRADLDRDGRISGAEAVSFFQGSALPKPLLAQIWNFADQNRAGFLGRQEFYNALKLVTVAQSKRDLTPDIVKAALYGAASSKIPPPQINLSQTPIAQSHPVATSPGMQMGAMTPTSSQNPGYRGPVPPNPNMNQQYFSSPGNLYPQPQSQGYPSNMGPRPTQSSPGQSSISSSGFIPGRPSSGMLTPTFSGSMPTPGVHSSGMTTPGLPSSGMPTHGRPSSGLPTPGLPNSGMSTDWMGGRTSGAPSLATSQVAANRGATPTPAPGNSFSSTSTIGDDPFAAFQTISKPSASLPAASSAIVPVSASPPASAAPTSSALVAASFTTQPLTMSNSLDLLQSPLVKQPVGGQHQQAQTFSSLSRPVRPVTSAGVSPGISVGAGNSASDQSQPPWPKMTVAGIQKYSKVFTEVDSDRDGKITGEQARNLFLSWRLPREVLKQVWDLADQDSDSMLSLREFCVALYLMERYREGRSLPASLPNSVMLDETLMRMTGLPNSTHGNSAWGASPATGLRPVQGAPASQGAGPAAGLRPGMHSVPRADGTMQSGQPKSSPLLLDESQSSPLDDGQKLQQSSAAELNDAEKKVEKVILDSREKLEFYRSKMQELVLYKSRCDNRLNEIIERAAADKREVELLGKKYEEKYKQVAEIASKLTIEEAKFREYQERKMELQQAIINMEQGGSADGILQVRADRIQSDFEELLKALSERCKKHGIEIKSAALIELPKGWQPGIQEGAAVWDEEWDKFEDEGLIFDKEIGIDAQNAKGSPKSTLLRNGNYPHEDGFSPDSPSKSEKHLSGGEGGFDGESGYAHSEDGSNRSPHGSPAHRAAPESPSRFSDVFAKSEADTDFHRSFDDHGWGTFDGTDDVDSVWGFNSKEEQHGDRHFEASGFSTSPRTDSPHRDMYNRNNNNNNNSPFNFADSVPGTPFSKSVNSPRYSEAGDNMFDNYSRFDSFSMSDSTRFSPPNETLARFDSISSRSGFGHSRGFNSFDDADPFGSSGPFKVSSETPKKGSDNWSSF